MAVIGPRIKKQTGTITTDGAGAAALDVAIPTGVGGARSETYKLIAVELANGDPAASFATPLTGGTVNVRDNSAAGTAVNFTITVGTEVPVAGGAPNFVKRFGMPVPVPVTNIRFTVAGGGATKKMAYRLVYARTK